MSIPITWNQATILRELKRCVLEYLPVYIQRRVDADAALPFDDRILQHLSFPEVQLFTGRHDDFAHDKVTPALFVDLLGQQWRNVDASQLQDVDTLVTVSVLLSERDVNADTANDFLVGASVYVDGVAWVIRSQFPVYRCEETGVIEAIPTRIPLSPPLQMEGDPTWLRALQVEATITHRTTIERG